MDPRDLREAQDTMLNLQEERRQRGILNTQAKEIAGNDKQKEALLKADKVDPRLKEKEYSDLLARKYMEGDYGLSGTPSQASTHPRSTTSFFGLISAPKPEEHEARKEKIALSRLPDANKAALIKTEDERFERSQKEAKAADLAIAAIDYNYSSPTLGNPYAVRLEELYKMAGDKSNSSVTTSFQSTVTERTLSNMERILDRSLTDPERTVLRQAINKEIPELENLSEQGKKQYIADAITNAEYPQMVDLTTSQAEQQQDNLSTIDEITNALGSFTNEALFGLPNLATSAVSSSLEYFTKQDEDARSWLEIFGKEIEKPLASSLTGATKENSTAAKLGFVASLFSGIGLLRSAAAGLRLGAGIGAKVLGASAPTIAKVTGGQAAKVGSTLIAGAGITSAAKGVSSLTEKGVEKGFESGFGRELNQKEKRGAQALADPLAVFTFNKLSRYLGRTSSDFLFRKTEGLLNKKGSPFSESKALAEILPAQETVSSAILLSRLREDAITSLASRASLAESVLPQEKAFPYSAVSPEVYHTAVDLAMQADGAINEALNSTYTGVQKDMQDIILNQKEKTKGIVPAVQTYQQAYNSYLTASTAYNELAVKPNRTPQEEQILKDLQLKQASYQQLANSALQSLPTQIGKAIDSLDYGQVKKILVPNSLPEQQLSARLIEMISTGNAIAPSEVSAIELADNYNRNLGILSPEFNKEMNARIVALEQEVAKRIEEKTKKRNRQLEQESDKANQQIAEYNALLPMQNEIELSKAMDEAFPGTNERTHRENPKEFADTIQASVVQEIRERKRHANKLYEEVEDKFNQIRVPDEVITTMRDQLEQYQSDIFDANIFPLSSRVKKKIDEVFHYESVEHPLFLRDINELRKEFNKLLKNRRFIEGNAIDVYKPVIGILGEAVEKTLQAKRGTGSKVPPDLLAKYKEANRFWREEVIQPFYNAEISPWLSENRRDFESLLKNIKNTSELKALVDVLPRKEANAVVRMVIDPSLKKAAMQANKPEFNRIVSTYAPVLGIEQKNTLLNTPIKTPFAEIPFTPPTNLATLEPNEYPSLDERAIEKKYQISGNTILSMLKNIETMQFLDNRFGSDPRWITIKAEYAASLLFKGIPSPKPTPDIAFYHKKAYRSEAKDALKLIERNLQDRENKEWIEAAFGSRAYKAVAKEVDSLYDTLKNTSVKNKALSGAHMAVQYAPKMLRPFLLSLLFKSTERKKGESRIR